MSMSRKTPVMISLLGLMAALLFCCAVPAQAFINVANWPKFRPQNTKVAA
jgi:hypothetical protein